MQFYLGTHEISWLTRLRDVPLYVSHRRLQRQATWPRATTPWALDSGGFTELSMFGGWKTPARDYVRAVRRYDEEIGGLEWASPQDWMCEDVMLRKTGRTVAEHQRLTVDNYLELRDLDAELAAAFAPVLQGQSVDDYLRCVDLYDAAGVDLAAAPIVGVGSVCRRQDTGEIGDLFEALAPLGLRLHGYGVKAGGLARYGHHLTSSDSLAWSSNARKLGWHEGVKATPECAHRTCANCLAWALQWRDKVLQAIGDPA